MFSRKIAQKIAQSQAAEGNRDGLRQLELEKIGALPRRVTQTPFGQHVPLTEEETKSDSQSSSKGRLAAGFGEIDSDDQGESRSSTSRRARQSTDENDEDDDDETYLPTSTNEIQEEYDPDTEDVQYPTQGYPPNDMLLEEYNQLVDESMDVSRGRSASRPEIRISRQPSRLTGNVVSDDYDDDEVDTRVVRKSVKKSAQKVPKKSSRSSSKERSRSRERQETDFISSPRESLTDYGSKRGSSSAPEKKYSKNKLGRTSSKTSKDRDGDGSSRSKDRDRESSSRSRERLRASASKERSLSKERSRDRESSRDIDRERRAESKQRLEESRSRSGFMGSTMNRIGSVASSIANIGSSIASTNPIRYSSSVINPPPPTGGSSLVFRDVAPLPIEIPENVADEESFRRYLSVRRRALPYLFDETDDDDENDADHANENNERSTVESLAGRTSQPGPYSRQPSKIDSRDYLPSIVSFQDNDGPPPSSQPPGYSLSSSAPPPPPSSSSQPNPQCIPCCQNNQNFQRKSASLSHAIMTLALLSASAAQLRFVVAYSHAHSYPTLNYFLICSCIIIEVLVGIGFVVLARFDFSEPFQDKLHSYLIFGLFVVTVANVIVAAFALDDHICEILVKKALNSVPAPVAQPLDPQLPYDSQLQQSVNNYI